MIRGFEDGRRQRRAMPRHARGDACIACTGLLPAVRAPPARVCPRSGWARWRFVGVPEGCARTGLRGVV